MVRQATDKAAATKARATANWDIPGTQPAKSTPGKK
jgi:hypothetical protein